VPADRFEQLFGTPHGVDLTGLAAAHGLPTAELEDLGDLPGLLGDGPRLVRVRTGRAANVAVHQAIHDAVLAVLD
jgi:2-succinyl-5-enolpyruvyl-6-hydroxy-3-cyclohexene-1-carboxylate synthase